MRTFALLLLGATLLLASGAEASLSGRSLQERRIEAGKSALEKLRRDRRRRRYRDGWESVLRHFEGAIKAAPSGPRAAEAALLAARTRVELWGVSRSAVDARAAISAFRRVEQQFPGPSGAEALLAEVDFGQRSGQARDVETAAARLQERYSSLPGVRQVLSERAVAKAARSARSDAAGSVAARALKTPGRGPPAPAPLQPADDDEDEDDEESPAGPAAVARAPGNASRETGASLSAAKPVSRPSDDVDVGREAAKVVEEMVSEARGEPAPPASTLSGPAPAAASPSKDEELPPEPEELDVPPPRDGPVLRAVKNAVAALTEPEDAPAAARRARDLRATALSTGSVSSQLGLKVRRIAIDAGHGGKDTGAIGPHGTREKDMTLAIARRAAAKLRAQGFEVILTRSDDRFVALGERTRIANAAKADLFVSIHCNAARRRKLAGVETWTLNVSSDRYASRLAAFENADADTRVSELRLILADLATKVNATDARELAESVQSSLVRTLRGRVGSVTDHGVKQALFYVLLGAHMPSVLVETAFISNPSEESRLRSARYQEGTAEAIARGVKEFVDGRQRYARAP